MAAEPTAPRLVRVRVRVRARAGARARARARFLISPVVV
jgi:hypothetical protein